VEITLNLSKYEDFTTRTVRKNVKGKPLICLCKELSWLDLNPGDKILVGLIDGRLEIIKLKESEVEL